MWRDYGNAHSAKTRYGCITISVMKYLCASFLHSYVAMIEIYETVLSMSDSQENFLSAN